MRELVFVYAMLLVIPQSVRDQYFPDATALKALLVFLGFLLRLWTIAGELMLSVLSHIIDFRGALNWPDAPGRVAVR